MKREEKNALTRQRIMDAAKAEFASRGYGTASLNMVCAEKDISKGIIYHYFKDKDELYLACVGECFEALTGYLEEHGQGGEASGGVEQRLRRYFDARLRFFAEHPTELGLFLSAVLDPPAHLTAEVAAAHGGFDALNVSTLTALLLSAPLREGVALPDIVEDFRLYMDYFNARFRSVLAEAVTPQEALEAHEERCHRQIGILLYGVLGEAREHG